MGGNVVYHPFPTSNHNCKKIINCKLLVVYHPFPTSNHNAGLRVEPAGQLYIILFLHQTTTYEGKPSPSKCCISSFSYIKPQLHCFHRLGITVVYHPFPTSNHNYLRHVKRGTAVVYHPFPTSNHNNIFVLS